MRLIVCRLIEYKIQNNKNSHVLRLKMSLIHIFAVNLKKYRTAQNLSQEYLAELAGLHRTYISALEREQRNISIENIQRIANALKIEPYRLLIENSDKND